MGGTPGTGSGGGSGGGLGIWASTITGDASICFFPSSNVSPCHMGTVIPVARGKYLLSPDNRPPNHSLLESDRIASADHAAVEHRGIDTHVSLIVLGRRPKDTHILGEISLGQRCHDAARAGAIDT